MKNLRIAAFLFLAALLAGCIGAPLPQPPTEPKIRITEEQIKERIERDKDRAKVLADSKNRYKDDAKCEDEDRRHECKRTCRDLYSGDARDDCEELAVEQIERLEEIHELLEDPDEDELADIDFEDFHVYIETSPEPFIDLINDYKSREARKFMEWMIREDEAAEIVRDKEDSDDHDDYSVLEALLEEIHGSSPDFESGRDIIEVFNKDIDRDSLLLTIIDGGNEEIMEWFMDFINDTYAACDDDESLNCFKLYCELGEDLRDDQDEWLSFPDFEEYIEDIIDAKTNGWDGPNGEDDGSSKGNRWCAEDSEGETNCSRGDVIEGLNDLDDDWTEELCGGLSIN